MSDVAPARVCAKCGALLSRFNEEELCDPCQRSANVAPPAAVDWLASDSAPAGDDAGAMLRAWRIASGMSQNEIADRMGWTQQHLSHIENGKTFTIEQRRRAVGELGIPPRDLGLSAQQVSDVVSADGTSQTIAKSRQRWRAERSYLNQHRSDLAKLAVSLYPQELRLPSTPLIAHPDLLPAEPVELRSINLSLNEERPDIRVDGSEPETLAVRPLRTADRPFTVYTDAIKHLDPPALFESRPSYRLVGASLPAKQLEFGLATYFDKLDVSEAVGHELAAVCMRCKDGIPTDPAAVAGQLPFRELISDPFDMQRRAVIPAITTLTIRLHRYPRPPTFLLHWRDPAKVATAGGTYDAIPAGEFQPSSVTIWDARNDFDLWRNVVREYSEELLGAPEHDGSRRVNIDYAAWPLYRDLETAQSDGTVTPYLLGIGLDALTLAATILTVVVFDDSVFDQLFGEMVQYNAEGKIMAVGQGTAAEGIPFTEQSVQRLLTSEPMASPGAACLALAWQHRDILLP